MRRNNWNERVLPRARHNGSKETHRWPNAEGYLTIMTVSCMIYPMAKQTKLSEQIRSVIKNSDMSRYEICKRLGYSESVMSRFMAGKCGLSLDTLDRLAELLDLHIQVGRRRRSKGR